jgi:geranylgeranyl reductase family protein
MSVSESRDEVHGTTSATTSATVIVVGGGPAGASAAWHLATAGLDVLVLDRARFPRDKPCGEYLSPEASRLLSVMGALEPVERAGAAQLAGMQVRAPNGRVIHGEFVAGHGFRGFRGHGLALRRRELDAILLARARAAGARVQEGNRVTDLLRERDGRVCGVRVLSDSGETRELCAVLVVGADGLRSVVARRLELARARRWPKRIALVTHFTGVAGIGACGEMHVERDGYVGLADVGHGVTNVAVVVPTSRGREIAGDATGFMDRWIARRPHLAPRLAAAERVTPVLAVGPFAAHARRPWAPGAALVGDAADFFDPFTGEGIYAALRCGELLAPFAVRAVRARLTGDMRAADDALAGYESAWRAAFGAKWMVEQLIGLAVSSPPLINHAARVLSRRRDMADLLVGVAGDFVPPREVLRPGYLLSLIASLPFGARRTTAPSTLMGARSPVATAHAVDASAGTIVP